MLIDDDDDNIRNKRTKKLFLCYSGRGTRPPICISSLDLTYSFSQNEGQRRKGSWPGTVLSRIPEPELFRGCPWALASRPALPPAAGKARRQGSARDRLGASARYWSSALHHIKAPWRRCVHGSALCPLWKVL